MSGSGEDYVYDEASGEWISAADAAAKAEASRALGFTLLDRM